MSDLIGFTDLREQHEYWSKKWKAQSEYIAKLQILLTNISLSSDIEECHKLVDAEIESWSKK